MDLLEMPVTLVVKAPNQKIADMTVECALDWTIRKLKAHLSTVYPSQPKEHQQKIIYSGKLLQDEMKLKDVLRQVDEERVYTVHLVCYTPEMMASSSSIQDNSNSSDSEGLRHRHTADSSSSPSVEPLSSSSGSSVQEHSSPINSTQGTQSTPAVFGASAVSGVNAMAAGYQGAAQLGYMGQMAAVPGMLPGLAYSPEQMLWLQQLYTQQMAQYMQYYQQGAVPATSMPLSHDQQPANQNPPAAQLANQAPERNQPIVMNAAGEAIMEDDDDDENINRDWLDWLYTLSRFGVLLAIVYFYSTFSRFLMVLGLFMFIYMYQAGWFVFRRDNRQQRPQQQQQQQQQQQEEQNRDEAQNAENAMREQAGGEQMEENVTDGAGSNHEDAAAPPPSILQIVINFILLFFTSLIPSQPPPVNAN